MANYVNQILVYDAGKNRKIGAADNLEVGGTFTAATFYGSAAGLTSIPSAQLTGALPALNAASLTDLNGSAINSGTVGKAYLPGTTVYTDSVSTVFTNGVTASTFSGDGSALTNLSAAQLVGPLPAIDGASLTNLDADNISSGTVNDARLSANVAKYNDAAPTFNHTVSAAGFSGSGAQLTSLDADNVSSGTLNDARLSLNVAKYNDAAPTFTNTVSAAAFSGSGAGLTGLDADNISAGTLADARLSANVPLLNAGSNTFSGSISASSFSGAGGSLTGLNAGNVTTGTLDDGRLTANVALYNAAAPTFTNTVAAAGFSGSGASLTGLNADNIATGTVADARLSANVLLKNAASNTLTGNLTVNGNLNVGGDIVSGGSVNVVLQDQFLDLNGNNLLGVAAAGGIAVNVESFGTTFDVEEFTAGGTGTDPTIVVSGDATAGFINGSLIQISQSASSNDGQYIVYSVSYNSGTGKSTFTLYGNADSAHPASTFPQMPFVHNQLTTATETAKLTAIYVGVMAVSNGALYGPGAVQIPSGVWCYAYGGSNLDFTNGWTSLEPKPTPSLQDVYTASGTPAEITLAAGKDFRILQPAAGTAAFNLEANANSYLIVTGAELEIGSQRTSLTLGNVLFEKAGGIAGVYNASRAEGDICYINSLGEPALSDQASLTDAALEVDGVVASATGDFATVAGTKVRAAYTGSAPVVGDVVYLSGGANAGKCQVAIPTSGRVTKLGKCAESGSAGLCTIIWAPDYIADL